MKILIAGDLVINQIYNSSNISQKVIELFINSDLNIVNLEAPVTNGNSKIIKTGPHLKSNEKNTLEVLKLLEIETITLANNHLLDFDQEGVKDTLAFCKKNHIKTVGAGMNLEEASKTFYLDTKEGKIAIVNFAENEWSSATEVSAGANPMDIIANANQIKEAKQKADFVFVIVHGGHEYYNLPSPRMQKQYCFYADQGADIIIGHHTHCINGFEVYNNVPIYYSLGNFLFTNSSVYEDWYIGLVLDVKIENGKLRTELHPVKQEKGSFSLKLLEKNEKQSVLNRISEYNRIISEPEKLALNWNNYVESKYDLYLNYWSPLLSVKNRYLKTVFKKLGIMRINKEYMALKLNIIRCEAHYDLSKEVAQKKLKK